MSADADKAAARWVLEYYRRKDCHECYENAPKGVLARLDAWAEEIGGPDDCEAYEARAREVLRAGNAPTETTSDRLRREEIRRRPSRSTEVLDDE